MPTPLTRRTGIIAAAAALAALLSSCADTVNGQGSPGTASGTPSGSSSGDFPSVLPTSALPSSGFPSTPAPSDTAATTGVLVRDPEGHFEARMPATPERSSQPGSSGGYSYTVHIATVKSPYIAIVEGEVVTPALPSDQIDVALSSAVSSFQSSSGLTLVSQETTTFQGSQARSAVLERAGQQYQLLVVGYSGSRIYLLFAPKGAKFDALAASFRVI